MYEYLNYFYLCTFHVCDSYVYFLTFDNIYTPIKLIFSNRKRTELEIPLSKYKIYFILRYDLNILCAFLIT